MEVLGAASGVISVTQLTGKVISIIYDYQRGARHASKQINAVKRELQQLRDVLERLEDLASDDENQSATLDAIEDPLKSCQAELQHLETVLTSEKGRFSRVGQALKWPLKEKEVRECLDILAGQRSVLQLALTADQSTVMLAIRDDVSKSDRHVTDLNDSFKSFTIDEYKEKIVNWLDAPDPSLNHNNACQARQPKTGLWLLNGSEYQNWRTETDRMLWLHGIPGCGKTILSSTVIQDLATFCRSKPKSLLLYFYFDFNNAQKQEVNMFLRSMMSQIACQQDRVSVSLSGLYERCDRGGRQPARELLITTLRETLQGSAKTFMVLDALDECTELQALLKVIAMVSGWQVPSLHLVCTSRRERQIVEVFDQLNVIETSIQNEQVDADIGLLVDDQLEHDPDLRRWPMDIKGEIRAALAKGSQGMFRWAVCQMVALKTCLKRATLHQALGTLPKTLDETYERILKNVNEKHIEDVLKMLRWLIYAKRPLTLGELAEAVAISVNDIPVFDPENRLRHPVDSLHLCSTLVNFTLEDLSGAVEENPVRRVVNLSHSSVQEYLLSNCDVSKERTLLSFEHSIAQRYIAKACLTYLLHMGRVLAGEQHLLSEAARQEYPLHEYTAEFSLDPAITIDGIIESLMEELFLNETAFTIWTDCSDRTWLISPHRRNVQGHTMHFRKATYVASYYGFTGLVEKLINHVENINLEVGIHGTALGAAAGGGHAGALRVLLEHGAKADVEFDYPCVRQNAMHAAVRIGDTECTRLLIAAGSCVNQKLYPRYGYSDSRPCSPLSIAAYYGHTDLVKFLIEEGADVNAMRGGSLTCGPLLEAVWGGSTETVQVLLGHGANVNDIGKLFGGRLSRRNTTPLLAAIWSDNFQTAKVLIDNGAVVNVKVATDFKHDTSTEAPLVTAARRGSKDTVQLLLEKGADVNVQDQSLCSEHEVTLIGTPLLFAVKRGHKEVVSLLLANGADVEVKGKHGNARETALANSHDDIAALLLSSA